MLERAQLFECFGLLHRRRRQRGEPQQALAAIDVQADVPPRRRRLAAGAHERNRRARKIHREAVAVDDDFGDVRIVRVRRGSSMRRAQRGHHQRAVGAQRRDGLVDHLRLDQRFVALHVDDRSAAQIGGDFGEAIGAALVRRRRHARVAAEGRHRVDRCARRRSRRSPT